MSDSYFILENVSRHFDVSAPFLQRVLRRLPRETLKAVDGVSLRLEKGETLSLVGESGCGKSTVARMAVGVEVPTAGSIRFSGTDLATVRTRRDLRRKINMIFQDPQSSLNPQWRVRRIIAEPIRAFGLVDGPAAILSRVHELLDRVGLAASDGDRFPHEFSGGQLQRISIARALASEPEFLVCDEPTSALDVSVQAQILNLMKDLQRERNLSYLFISHNLAVVRHMSDKLAVMYLGRIVECGDSEAVMSNPQHPYTRMLLDALPDIAVDERVRTPILGEVPSPIHPPSGCSFHPRCPHANERCGVERPALLVHDGCAVACHAVSEGRLHAASAPRGDPSAAVPPRREVACAS